MTLIKLLVISILIYALSDRILPVCVFDTVNSLVSRYLWGVTKDRKNLHLVDWNSVTLSFNKRGLGISRLFYLNTILISKLIYRFDNKRNSLWRKMVCAKSGSNPSRLLPTINRSSRKSSMFNLVGMILDRNALLLLITMVSEFSLVMV